MIKIKIKTLSYIVGLLTAVQLTLFGVKRFFFVFIERNEFTDSVATMLAMVILSGFTIMIAQKRGNDLSVFPRAFKKFYIIGTCAAVFICITAPSNYTGGSTAIVMLIYSAVVTPVFEELLFRGYIWNKLKTVYKNKLG